MHGHNHPGEFGVLASTQIQSRVKQVQLIYFFKLFLKFVQINYGLGFSSIYEPPIRKNFLFHTLLLHSSWIRSWRTPLKIAFGGSFSPFAFTARTTVKLCLSPPQDKIGTVRFPVFLWLATRISSGFRPCSGCGWTPYRNAVWLSTRSDGIPLPCLPCRN